MSAVTEAIVREYFEQRGFMVHQQRKYVSTMLRDEEEMDFLVFNPKPLKGEGPLPFVLGSQDVVRLERAVVEVKASHTQTYSPAQLKDEPEMFRFLEPAIFKQAAKFFGDGGAVSKILIIPALPHDETLRQQSLDLLRAKGLDGIIPFGSLLADLVASTEPNRNYQKSDVLQVIRLLKNYDLLRESQMELFKQPQRKPTPPAKRKATPLPESTAPPAAPAESTIQPGS